MDRERIFRQSSQFPRCCNIRVRSGSLNVFSANAVSRSGSGCIPAFAVACRRCRTTLGSCSIFYFCTLPNSYSPLAQRATFLRRHRARCTTLMFILILHQLELVPSSQGTPAKPVLASGGPVYSLASRARPDPALLPPGGDSYLFAGARREFAFAW